MDRIGSLKGVSSLFEDLGKESDAFGDGMNLLASVGDFSANGIQNEREAEACAGDSHDLGDNICRIRLVNTLEVEGSEMGENGHT